MGLFKRKKDTNIGIASFEKVSFEQFKEDWEKIYGTDLSDTNIIKLIYDKIRLPERSTKESAGYDFFAPFGFTLEKGSNILIPTGIRAFMDHNALFSIYPRSGMGFKYRVMLANTVALIDADYWKSDNEGHIMIKLCYEGIEPQCSIELLDIGNPENISFKTKRKENHEYKPLIISQGDKFVQGVFSTYGLVDDDCADGIRNGGTGSTGK